MKIAIEFWTPRFQQVERLHKSAYVALTALVAAVFIVANQSWCGAQTRYQVQADSMPQPGVPQGKMFQFDYTASWKYYPGTTSTIWVYVPAEYSPDKPACLCVGLDGPAFSPQAVFDNLIYKKEMPVTIGVFVSPGTVDKAGTTQPLRYDRCYEFDSVNDNFDRFLFDEILPAVQRHKTPDGRPIRFSMDPNDHMIYGASSGGVCAFTAAWQHPDLFRRVFSAIGTYVGMRGADMYPTLIRKTEPKPIRIFQQDGAQDTWNPLFDNWFTQNKSMEESLRFAGYDADHNWGVLGHEPSQGESLFPDAVKWLWRDYPKPIEAGISGNSMLRSVLAPGQSWQPVGGTYTSPADLAVDLTGNVSFYDAKSAIYRIAADGVPRVFAHCSTPVTAQSFGPEGRLYAASSDGKIFAVSPQGKLAVFVRGICADGLYVSSDGVVFATEPGVHEELPSKIWRITPAGSKKLVDQGLHGAAGVVMTPDHNLLFAIEGDTHWIDSYVVQQNGTLADKQRFYWLHTAESADDAGDNSGASAMAEDTQGDLFVATRMGVQICDRNGRVEGILTLPQGAVTSLCFGGQDFHTLYIICGGRIYQRSMKCTGVPNWAKPITLPPFNPG